MAPTKTSSLLSVLAAAGVADGARPMQMMLRAQDTMSATVYGEPTSRYPKGIKQIVELLRFTTGYDYGLETLVDMTPYAPLIDAITKSEKGVEAYTYIDTWVGRNTGWHIDSFLQADSTNSSHKSVCQEVKVGRPEENQGNGWGVTAELILWEKQHGIVDVRPRQTITVASGPEGSSYEVGTIRYHHGITANDGKSVLLEKAADFASETHRELSVYRCPAGGESFLEQARRNFLWSKDLYDAHQQGNADRVQELIATVHKTAAQDQLRDITIMHVDKATGNLVCQRNSDVEPAVGMPVFLNGPDIHSSFLQGRGENAPAGKVVAVTADTFSVDLECGCTLTDKTKDAVHLKIPQNSDWKSAPDKLASAFQKYAEQLQHDGANASVSGGHGASLLAVQDRASGSGPAFVALGASGLEPLRVEGSVEPLGAGDGARVHPLHSPRGSKASGVSFLQSGSSLGNGVHVCVVDEQHTGLLLDRRFDVPVKRVGDRVLLQFVVTGHGWANTQFQCGEFCHALYAFSFNGKPGPKVTLWRDDCPQNPWGSKQAGTWEELRNGWCPGAVEPGVFLDVTDHINEGHNSVELDMWVYNEADHKYERFTDISGYNKHDTAWMVVGTTFSVYPKTAVDAIRTQDKAYTPAEQALRTGSSEAKRLVNEEIPAGSSLLESAETMTPLPKPHRSRDELRKHRDVALERGIRTPMGVMVTPQSLLEARADVQRAGHIPVADYSEGCQARVRPGSSGSGLYDFEGAAPWYCYSTEKDGDVATGPGVHRITLFEHSNVASDSRVVTTSVNGKGMPAGFQWGRAALHFRLDRPNFEGTREDGQPYPNEFDHWDRLGSVGFHLTDDGPRLSLFPAADGQKKEWSLQAASHEGIADAALRGSHERTTV